jgi:hypothetical protein
MSYFKDYWIFLWSFLLIPSWFSKLSLVLFSFLYLYILYLSLTKKINIQFLGEKSDVQIQLCDCYMFVQYVDSVGSFENFNVVILWLCFDLFRSKSGFQCSIMIMNIESLIFEGEFMCKKWFISLMLNKNQILNNI